MRSALDGRRVKKGSDLMSVSGVLSRLDFQRDCQLPTKLKVKKRINFWPLELCGTGIWKVHEGGLDWKLSCKDTYLRGKLSWRRDLQVLEYRKRLPLPIPYVGRLLGGVVGTVQWSLANPTLRPHVGIGLELGKGTVLTGGMAFDFKQKFGLTEGAALEARGSVGLTLPPSLSIGTGGLSGSDGGDEFKVNMRLTEANFVIEM